MHPLILSYKTKLIKKEELIEKKYSYKYMLEYKFNKKRRDFILYNMSIYPVISSIILFLLISFDMVTLSLLLLSVGIYLLCFFVLIRKKVVSDLIDLSNSKLSNVKKKKDERFIIFSCFLFLGNIFGFIIIWILMKSIESKKPKNKDEELNLENLEKEISINEDKLKGIKLKILKNPEAKLEIIEKDYNKLNDVKSSILSSKNIEAIFIENLKNEINNKKTIKVI